MGDTWPLMASIHIPCVQSTPIEGHFTYCTTGSLPCSPGVPWDVPGCRIAARWACVFLVCTAVILHRLPSCTPAEWEGMRSPPTCPGWQLQRTILSFLATAGSAWCSECPELGALPEGNPWVGSGNNIRVPWTGEAEVQGLRARQVLGWGLWSVF
jgi:hypothetical protein